MNTLQDKVQTTSLRLKIDFYNSSLSQINLNPLTLQTNVAFPCPQKKFYVLSLRLQYKKPLIFKI